MDRTHPQKTNHRYNKTRPELRNPAGKRRRRPRNTWQRAVKDEAKKVGKS